MAKTQATIDLENALDESGRKKREYGCKEVTIGFHREGHGDEIVDYMTMDAQSVFRCYELKVTLSDLKTDNKKSFYGDYNYLVVSESLYRQNPVWDNWIPPYCGILCGTLLKTVRSARKKQISDDTRNMLKDSLIRTLYWKMVTYMDADKLAESKELQKQLEAEKEEIEEKLREADEKLWTYDDFERYYRLNHQNPGFTIAVQAKEERKQYADRKNHHLIYDHTCMRCGFHLRGGEKYCPSCGMDLRLLDDANLIR